MPDRKPFRHGSLDELQQRLEDAAQALLSIHEGEPNHFSLLDTISRSLVENMKEAALVVTSGGRILCCNARFADLLKRPLSRIVGHFFQEFVSKSDESGARTIIEQASRQRRNQRLVFLSADKRLVPSNTSVYLLNNRDIFIVVSDLTESETLMQEL